MELAAGALCVVACGLTAVAVALAVVTQRRRQRRLRHCPICDADAVAADVREVVDTAETRIELRCGQCATWRRLVTTPWAVRAYDEWLATHRQAIADELDRLEEPLIPSG
jgi:formate dehydrogenase maturation protein FdhE